MTDKPLGEYVISSLTYGQGELRARFLNEFSDEERTALADAARSGDERIADLFGGTDWLFEVLPELSNY